MTRPSRSVARRVERSHDPGDTACVEHDPSAIYTMVVHLCPVCRPAQNDQERQS